MHSMHVLLGMESKWLILSYKNAKKTEMPRDFGRTTRWLHEARSCSECTEAGTKVVFTHRLFVQHLGCPYEYGATNKNNAARTQGTQRRWWCNCADRLRFIWVFWFFSLYLLSCYSLCSFFALSLLFSLFFSLFPPKQNKRPRKIWQ